MSDMTGKNQSNVTGKSFWQDIDLRAVAPFVALAVLLIFGTLVNPNFIGVDNLLNIATRSAFIAIIAIGATFVIASGGLDLSVGSMSAFVAAVTILFMNSGIVSGNLPMLILAMSLAIAVGAACGLANGTITTMGRIEPFIVTLGTMGIFRALTIYLAEGGSIAMKSQELRAAYRPVYFGNILGIPIPIVVIIVVALIAAFLLYRTAFGRHVIAVGSNQDVARYSGIPVRRVRTLAFVIQGICVAIAVLVYVPRLGAATPTTGLMWELQAITAVVIGGTALRGGVGRIWGTVCGALILEVVGNIMVLSDLVSEYLIGAVQGAIIIIAMLVQRSLSRRQ
ncbi:ABC transporter permease [Bacillus subtilis]|uniref:Monosaccharide ABC transporter membrane protein (CUT2 family) n=2 Tax=Pseudochrobactrum asaccharolyticum TaxID=354351 RepID=A0A366E0S2_9HYPH|nr:ABC transporter permease [Pseudochrobactrum asaccharolyticum]MCF7646598.1 ABC transporter permease [Pseudochrobactrum asaccharolyticum]MCF7672737.1 ABC transporter permease [Bacillus subtilis]RBO95715.1 monosaccharide ABC transporter membrane protein (CUT2 family) [Pseudochrobactrum asaccharolyticum]